MNRTFAVCVIAAFFAIVANPLMADEPLTHTKDSLALVNENVKAGKAVIVDVREQDEWDAGHLKGAVLLPQSKL